MELLRFDGTPIDTPSEEEPATYEADTVAPMNEELTEIKVILQFVKETIDSVEPSDSRA